MSDFITFLLFMMGQPPQEPVATQGNPEVSAQSGGIPIQPNNQPLQTPKN